MQKKIIATTVDTVERERERERERESYNLKKEKELKLNNLEKMFSEISALLNVRSDFAKLKEIKKTRLKPMKNK